MAGVVRKHKLENKFRKTFKARSVDGIICTCALDPTPSLKCQQTI